ncbi:S1-like domain-containing RNA-binding protein [Methylomonas sp. SURF-2]|uniref:S1-like domain-containing RNA-binding protein n=1 Tax=Methylomonas subterranea TaxID=2952225 RepID=A0ABT1TDP1_9GAMM|nr:S1-like domain-containing RNA-binding protein [Methylomonas sp. SURF-2]MCQ8103566.1 S1-like domain-containing RNA-binding protein [Methylomonas sp. SURF-2]
MIELGRLNTLTITDKRDRQLYLDGGELGEIALADKEVDGQVGDSLQVFVYIDGKNQTIATTQIPKAQVDEVAWLKVVSLSHAGAFLDWGLPKDLLLPFSEQKGKMVEGRSVLVRLFLDEHNRIAASMLLDDFIRDEAFYHKDGQAVTLIIAEETELGFKAVVDHKYWGVLYKNEIFQPLQRGQVLSGFIKKVRPDRKLDLMLSQEKYGQKVDATSDKILAVLAKHGGYIGLTDKSPPEMIYDTFAVSKKVFKQAIGGLYKQRRIVIEDKGIRLVDKAAG